MMRPTNRAQVSAQSVEAGYRAIFRNNGFATKRQICKEISLGRKSVTKIIEILMDTGRIYIKTWTRDPETGANWIPVFAIGDHENAEKPTSHEDDEQYSAKLSFEAACAAMLKNTPRYGFWGI